jgi:hypothetical protein
MKKHHAWYSVIAGHLLKEQSKGRRWNARILTAGTSLTKKIDILALVSNCKDNIVPFTNKIGMSNLLERPTYRAFH